jgi:hypothetical protein
MPKVSKVPKVERAEDRIQKTAYRRKRGKQRATCDLQLATGDWQLTTDD